MKAKVFKSALGMVLVLASLWAGTAQAAPNLPEVLDGGYIPEVLHVGSILAGYAIMAGSTAPSASAASYTIWSVVTVHGPGHMPMSGATVTVRWREPNGIHVAEQATTDLEGQARFQIVSGLQGVYRVSVTGVSKVLWGYAPRLNEQTSASLNVPRVNCIDGLCPAPEPTARLICIDALCPTPIALPTVG